MTNQNRVSLPVIKRLPKYFRYVSEMKQSGITKISSSELAKTMGTTASQVRQDFNCFGGFGQQGIGYNVDVLLDELTKLLFSEHKLNTVLIGTGKLGHAISGYLTAEARGYHLLSAFDINPKEVGREVCGVKIRHIDELEDFCKETKPQIAVLCVPRES
ncbi:MAG: redox-sensing transcriptional repressor Rex, partial [Oscillospiraceae bacterium]